MIYHSGYRHLGGPPSDGVDEWEKTGRLSWLTDLAEIPEKHGVSNVYGDLGAIFAWNVIAQPVLAAAMMGTLVKGLGHDRIIWGTDSVWTGSPQWQIEGLRRLEIPEDMQKKHGFKPLGAADGPVKNAILGENGRRLFAPTRKVGLESPDRFALMKAECDRQGGARRPALRLHSQADMKVQLLPLAVSLAALAPAGAQTAARLYVMDCSHKSAKDQSIWSPGINVGKPIGQADTCSLIKHGSQWLLWDTGYPDAITDAPVDTPVGHATRAKTLMGQLAEIGVEPGDIALVAASHTHPDHIGNVDRLPASLLLIQKAEFDWAFAPGKRPLFKKDRPLKLLEGDYDVFGDGSVMLLSTPGHTPGHQSLLVHLAKSGWILLAGDAAHFEDNWDNDRVPSMNTSAEQTHASHARLAKVLAEKNAQLWISHDLPTFENLKHSPQFYD